MDSQVTDSQFNTLVGLQQKAGLPAFSPDASPSVPESVPIPAVVPSDALSPKPSLTIPDLGKNGREAASSFVAAAAATKPGVDEYVRMLTPSPESQTEAQRSATGLRDRLSALIGLDTGKTAALQSAEDSQQVPKLRQEIADLNGQIASRVAQFNAEEAALGTDPNLTRGARSGYDQAVRNAAAASIGLLQAQVVAKTGQLSTAQDLAQRAVDLQYAPIEEEIAAKQAQLQLIQPQLDKEEKVLAAAQAQALQDRKDAIEAEKAEKKAVQDLVINAASQAAPQDLVTRASKAATAAEAAQILGVYAGDALGRQYKLAQIASLRGSGGGSDSGGAGTLSSEDRTLQQILSDPNIKISQGTRTSINDAQGVIESVKQLVENNPDGKFKGQGALQGSVGKFLNLFRSKDAKSERLENNSAIEIVNLKVQQWASGANLTDTQTAQVGRLTPDKNDTDFQIRTKINSLVDLMNAQIRAALLSQGVDYNPPKSDLFQPSAAKEAADLIESSGYSDEEILSAL